MVDQYHKRLFVPVFCHCMSGYQIGVHDVYAWGVIFISLLNTAKVIVVVKSKHNLSGTEYRRRKNYFIDFFCLCLYSKRN